MKCADSKSSFSQPKDASPEKLFSTPLGYFERDGGYLIVASNGGGANHPSWYHNIKGNPDDVMIQVKDKKMKVKPEIILGEPRKPL